MKFYLAPMEAVTGYIFRNAYKEFFGDVDTYITPFIKGKKLGSKEKNDVNPENNMGINVVPQVLTNKVEEFLYVAETMKNTYGYDCINLNLGCPSGTVVSKKKGAGFLSDLPELEKFLDEIFLKSPVNISIKTRIGIDSLEECSSIIKLFNKYPIEELIVHPRLQKEFYKGKPHLEIFNEIINSSVHSLCYNGDIKTVKDYENIRRLFPSIDKVMIGRGLLINPGLVGEIKGKEPMSKETFVAFHNKVYEGYKGIMSGDTNTLYKMKELWTYFIHNFYDADKYLKKIKKAQKFQDYNESVNEVFRESKIKT